MQYRLNCYILGIYSFTKEICRRKTKKIANFLRFFEQNRKKVRDFHKSPTDPGNGSGPVLFFKRAIVEKPNFLEIC